MNCCAYVYTGGTTGAVLVPKYSLYGSGTDTFAKALHIIETYNVSCICTYNIPLICLVYHDIFKYQTLNLVIAVVAV